MIKVRKGKVDIKGNECDLIAEFMCLMCSIAVSVIIPTHGKENLKTELCKIVDEVFNAVLESEEENE